MYLFIDSGFEILSFFYKFIWFVDHFIYLMNNLPSFVTLSVKIKHIETFINNTIFFSSFCETYAKTKSIYNFLDGYHPVLLHV